MTLGKFYDQLVSEGLKCYEERDILLQVKDEKHLSLHTILYENHEPDEETVKKLLGYHYQFLVIEKYKLTYNFYQLIDDIQKIKHRKKG